MSMYTVRSYGIIYMFLTGKRGLVGGLYEQWETTLAVLFVIAAKHVPVVRNDTRTRTESEREKIGAYPTRRERNEGEGGLRREESSGGPRGNMYIKHIA